MGLYALEEIFEQVSASRLSGEKLEEELLRLVRIYNYVPDELVRAYKAAVADEYRAYEEEKAGGAGG